MLLLDFVLNTTYFSFRIEGRIYQQRFATAMESPVIQIVANIYMKWLEAEALQTAPEEIKCKVWKSYADIFEISQEEGVDKLP